MRSPTSGWICASSQVSCSGSAKTISPIRARSTLALGSHLGPPALDQPAAQRLGFEQFVDDGVAGEGRRAQSREGRQRLGLTGRDAAGEADRQRHRPRSGSARTPRLRTSSPAASSTSSGESGRSATDSPSWASPAVLDPRTSPFSRRPRRRRPRRAPRRQAPPRRPASSARRLGLERLLSNRLLRCGGLSGGLLDGLGAEPQTPHPRVAPRRRRVLARSLRGRGVLLGDRTRG